MSAPTVLTGPVLIVGAGLLGTSVGLAVRRHGSVDVHLVDTAEANARRAAELGAGTVGWPDADPQLVVVAVPPLLVGQVVVDVQKRYPTSVVTDLASVKAVPQHQVEALGGDLTRFVGGHPLAGREQSGPQAGRSDLFEARPWVVTASPTVPDDAVRLVHALVETCGALVVDMAPHEHDAAVALVSHLPHVVAAMTAARLAGQDPRWLALAGQGVRDVTRIAASDPDLWLGILEANAGEVVDLLGPMVNDLGALKDALTVLAGATDDGTAREVDDARDDVLALLAVGNAGRSSIPGKHGGASERFASVAVVVPDEPRALARIFGAAGDAGVNIEDVSIEHSPGQPVGLVELAVRPEAEHTLVDALRAGGWTVQD
jgi:prephenate dehydrogenase